MTNQIDTENSLVLQHTGLIIVQAVLFNPTSLSDFDDYVSAGRLGLLKAIRGFNPDKNTKFSTYATTCIRREMIREAQRDKDNELSRSNIQYPATIEVEDCGILFLRH